MQFCRSLQVPELQDSKPRHEDIKHLYEHVGLYTVLICTVFIIKSYPPDKTRGRYVGPFGLIAGKQGATKCLTQSCEFYRTLTGVILN